MIQVLLWKGEHPSNAQSSEMVVQYKETTQFSQVYRIIIDYHRAQPRVNDARLLIIILYVYIYIFIYI